ncbi:MAG: nucleoside hydrolase, partial [Candidatus Obscuribacterales bacterium]|nr:nucleoside hydrolase [Candidatus Obscuribacterales bacterium]
MKARVLIDTDIAIGEPNRDIDDALALVMAVNSPDLTIDSITLTYGNDSLENVLNSMGRLEGISSFPPLLSASGAESSQDLGKATAATGLLASQLEKDPATIVAIGPLTNIASLILLRPELTSRVTEVIAVAGRRPGQLFRTGEHPRSHPDLNFERDPEAFAVLLGSQIPVVLAPFE